jgi:FtsH-binding integral membrane protein
VAYKEVSFQFLYVELLITVVGCMLIVYVESEEGVAHKEVRIQFLHAVILVVVVVYIPIVYVEKQKVVAHTPPLACPGPRMHFLDE